MKRMRRYASISFQCSSASRKFLKIRRIVGSNMNHAFQCSSASRKFLNRTRLRNRWRRCRVSVLFSEPKIPQRHVLCPAAGPTNEFQCSSASRKFLNREVRHRHRSHDQFQCSSASRKFLNPTLAPASIHISDRDDHASSFLSLPGASP